MVPGDSNLDTLNGQLRAFIYTLHLLIPSMSRHLAYTLNYTLFCYGLAQLCAAVWLKT